ncbi:MAG: hypothetical protein LH480_16125 [Rubrivivax sp.]|nr:hypothetical protein [Rubrivivax sp.]
MISSIPAFLTVLCRTGDVGTRAAQSAVVEALVDALRSGRLPSGRRAACGAQHRAAMTAPTHAQSLGPIGYLCAWCANPGLQQAPSAATFDRALQSLLRLVGHSPRARSLHAQRLPDMAEDPLGGTLTRRTRHVLQQLAEAWSAPQATPQSTADACIKAMGHSGLGALRAPAATHGTALRRL